ncbi:MAG: thioredoxin [Kouleothrix sp.]|nr:thioredoxin [Kouleothrix sp.]
MIDRIIVLIGLALTIVAAWGLVRLWRSWKVRGLQSQSPLAGMVPAGRPAIVAFSTPSCSECRTRQAPALARLVASLGDTVTVRSLSALEHPELVQQIGILTVPATVVLDPAGAVRHLNLGYASDVKLREQVLGAA